MKPNFVARYPRCLATLVAGILLTSASASIAADLSGCWVGEWKGCTDGLKGTVNARITRCDATHYKAVFTGRAFKIMPYRYTSILTACQDPETGRVRFKCTQKLPIWGCYWMNGWTDGCQFVARYHTDDHVGYFKMRRTCCKK